MKSTESRYEAVTRRAFLKRTAAFGVAAAFGLSACGDDSDAFSTSTTAAATATTAAAGTATTVASTTTSADAETSTSEASTGSLVAAGSELAVAFTYTADDSGDGRGGIRNPYVAVWVEDAAGDLVDTIAVYYLQSQKGLRWISDLKRWYTVDGSDDSLSTLSSATRAPGDYAVVWDCTDIGGGQVAAGEYYVCIEAAREHGPYSLIREAVTLAEASFSQDLTDEGELNSASVQLTIA